jgi:hypothetical protein
MDSINLASILRTLNEEFHCSLELMTVANPMLFVWHASKDQSASKTSLSRGSHMDQGTLYIVCLTTVSCQPFAEVAMLLSIYSMQIMGCFSYKRSLLDTLLVPFISLKEICR